MATLLKATSNADIKRNLNEIVDYHLFESTSWPIADDEVRPFFRMLEEMGLQETVPGTKDTSRYTALGIDCGTELAVCFIGAHEPYEIPMILKRHGLIHDAEEEAFHSFLIEELAGDGLHLKHVEALVRRAHARLFRVEDKLKLESAKNFNAESGADASNSPTNQCVVIEGPLSHDVDFAIMWLKAARKAGSRWDRLTWNNPEADELWEKLCSYNPMYETLDHRPDLDFGAAALSFVGEWLSNASFVLNVSSSRWSEHFSLMLFAGLFVQTDGRYQMAIPDEIDIRKICDRLSDWLKRLDQENLNPNDIFVTLSERDAKSWESRLRHMKPDVKAANRKVLFNSSGPWQLD